MKTVLLLAAMQAQFVVLAVSKGTAVPGDVKYVELGFFIFSALLFNVAKKKVETGVPLCPEVIAWIRRLLYDVVTVLGWRWNVAMK